MDETVEFLSGLLALGVPIFAPTPAGDGYHRGSGWQQYTAEGNGERLGRYRPGTDALCGLCGDQIAVVDVDPRNGADIDAVATLLNDLGVTVYAAVETPGGGRHYYVAGHPALRSAHFRPDHPQWPGLDIQSHGTNVFLPGTHRHDKGYSGRGYRIIFDNLAALADGGDPDGTDALADWVAAQTPVHDERPDAPPHDGHPLTDHENNYLTAALDGECADVAHTPTGGRNARLNVAAYKIGQLVAGAGLDTDTAYTALAAAAHDCGLPPTEAAATIRSGLTGGHQHPRHVPDDDPGEWNIELARWAGLPDDTADDAAPDTIPDQFWTARPELTVIRQWAHARICSPWAVLGAVLLRIACCIPPWVTLPPVIGGPGSLNLIVALVGPPGSGKDAALAVAEGCYPGRLEPLHTAGLATGEGIAHQYKHRTRATKDNPTGELIEDRHTCLFVCSEVDTAKGNSDRAGSTLLSKLRDAYSGNDIGGAYASLEKRLPMPKHSYRFGLAMCVQPLHAQWILDDVAGGLPQRLVWMPTLDPGLPDDIPATPPGLLAPPTAGTFSGSAFNVVIPDEIAQLLRQTQQIKIKTGGAGLDGHALFTREKIAYLFAVLDGRKAVLTLDDWELAGHVMAMSNRTRAAVQRALQMSGQQHAEREAQRAGHLQAVAEESADARRLEKVVRRITAKFSEHGGQMTRTEFKNLSNSRTRRAYAEALEHLVDIGSIQKVNEDGLLVWAN